jgi:hypothetical protein
MVNNYKILRKAQLADELFLGEDDAAAWEQDQADLEWRRAVDEGPPEAAALPAQPGPALLEQREEIPLIDVIGEPEDSRALVAAPPPPPRGWTQILADLTGNPVLEGIRTLGVCALAKKKGAHIATAALAQWMTQWSDASVLAVEAHFRESRLARTFHAREDGLAEALTHDRSVDSLVQDTSEVNLKLLAGGASMSRGEKQAALRGFPALFASLRERFGAVIVELPAMDDPALDQLPLASITDAVILVADSKTALPGQLRRAADKLREARTPLAATLLDATQMISAQLRHHRLAQQLQRVEPSQGGGRLML